jgi:RNA polymerase sigma factor (sigma-70 family)
VALRGEKATGAGARKRAAAEVVARYEPALRRTARRYSLSAEDAEDAFQRAMEILVLKAPTTDPTELVRWAQTVTKNEALAVRRCRKRSAAWLAKPPRGALEGGDWLAVVASDDDGPHERAERSEAVARSREALRALKPAERRALTLLAGGCSYAEIGRITGFGPSKVNRCIAEGRERFRRLLSSSEDGSRCAELRPHLSAFCDGEAGEEQAERLREHLRACGACRAALRAYRAAPRAAAALAPAPLGLAALLERLRELGARLQAQLPGGRGGGDAALAGGGAKGAGTAVLAKAAAVCAGAAGSAAACVAAGVVPAPLGIGAADAGRPAIERSSERSTEAGASGAASRQSAVASRPRPSRRRKARDGAKGATEADAGAAGAEATGYAPTPEASAPEALPPEPAPEPSTTPEAAPPSSSSGSAEGEFGP